MPAKAVDAFARGVADIENAEMMSQVERELMAMDVEGAFLTQHVSRARIDASRAHLRPYARPRRARIAPRHALVVSCHGNLTRCPLPFPPAVDRQCAQMHEAADKFAENIRKELNAQLLKIPEKVRGLTLREFLPQFGRDVSPALAATLRENAGLATRTNEDVNRTRTSAEEKGRKRGRPWAAAVALLDTAHERLARSRGATRGDATARVENDHSPSDFASTEARTPAWKRSRVENAENRTTDAVPCTPVDQKIGRIGKISIAQTPGTTRGPKRGEVLYSKNGSPLGAAGDSDDEAVLGDGRRDSCVKRAHLTAGKAGRGGVETETSLVLTTDDGKEIDVAAIGADGGAEVEETMGMLAKMQAQVAAHMARLMAGRRN